MEALPPLVPPLRFSMVEEGIYRGAYPSLINLRFLTRLRLCSVISLLPEAPVRHITEWCEAHGVSHHAERVPVFKEEVTLTQERLSEVLQLLVRTKRQPVYLHCLDGVSVTGTVIMCLRRLQRWSVPPTVEEYSRFARGGAEVPTPPPAHVLGFLQAFHPEQEISRLAADELPPWLRAALADLLLAADEGAASGESARGGGSAAANPRLPRPNKDDRDAAGGGWHHRERERVAGALGDEPLDLQAPAISSNLAALAIEGLTAPGAKHNRASLLSGGPSADLFGHDEAVDAPRRGPTFSSASGLLGELPYAQPVAQQQLATHQPTAAADAADAWRPMRRLARLSSAEEGLPEDEGEGKLDS
jgi:tyrosine-protein phosphatase OCA6